MRLTLALAALAGLALVAGATARVVPQRGIAGVELNMSKAEVRAQLGQPRSVRRGRNIFGVWVTYRYRGIQVTFQGGVRVSSVYTTLRRERTPSSVGVGSTEAFLRARLRGERCRTESQFRHCWLGSFRPGKTVTDFSIRRGRVTRVVVGFVLD